LGEAAAGLELVELTATGLALVAAQQGLPLGAAIRTNGLAGGGPERPLGARRKLALQLAHTVGADDIFVRLVAAARPLAAAGGDTPGAAHLRVAHQPRPDQPSWPAGCDLA